MFLLVLVVTMGVGDHVAESSLQMLWCIVPNLIKKTTFTVSTPFNFTLCKVQCFRLTIVYTLKIIAHFVNLYQNLWSDLILFFSPVTFTSEWVAAWLRDVCPITEATCVSGEMDRCKHVVRLRLGQDHSILNPQKWQCVDCSTTDSVWACLKCSHVACGRFMEEHSLKHFQESHHPLAMEVRELDVFCFACGDYVLNDNAEGDLKLLRGALSTVRSPGRRSLRSSTGGESGPHPAMQLALRHRRKALLGKMFQMWTTKHQDLQNERKEKLEEARRQKKEVKRRLMEELVSVPPRKSARLLTQAPRSTITLIPRKFRDPPERLPPPPKKPSLLTLSRKVPQNGRPAKLRRYYSTHAVTRRRLAPGVTGLRNLGNTCYMNSILQVLSHLQKFRECFLTLDLCETEELLAKTNHSQGMKGVTGGVVSSDKTALSGCPLGRMGKAGYWNLPVSKKESVPPPPQAAELVQLKEPRSSPRQQMSLCHELHTLFRVMWSGRWALVSPFAMLHSVWNLIPAFRGYDQQDAQEFLCELLDKVQQELDTEGSRRRIVIPITKRKLSKQVLKVLNTIFHGQLLSQVRLSTHQTHTEDFILWLPLPKLSQYWILNMHWKTC